MLVNEMFVGPQLLKRKAGVASSKIQIFEFLNIILFFATVEKRAPIGSGMVSLGKIRALSCFPLLFGGCTLKV